MNEQEEVARMDTTGDSKDNRTAPANEPTHTPGPWRAAIGDDDDQRAGEFELACLEHHIYGTNIYAPGEYYSDSHAEHLANAHLIAAAPELLAALKAIQKYVLSEHDMGLVDAAIAKAEG